MTTDATADASLPVLEQVFWQSPAFMIVLSGPEFIIEMANPSYFAMVGRSDIIGRKAFEIFPRQAAEGFRDMLERVRETGMPLSGREVPFTLQDDADGFVEHHVVDFTYLPLRDHTGTVTRVLVHGMDVTAHVLARARVERENRQLVTDLEFDRERLRSLIRVMPIPVAIHFGPDHQFEIVSDGMRAASGGREHTGLTPREVYPELAGQAIFERLDEVRRTGIPWISNETPMRVDRRGRGIEEAWFNVRFEPIRDPDGTIVGILNISIDVTDDVRARRDTLAMNEELTRQQRETERTNSDLHEVAIELAVRTLEAEDARRDVERLLLDSEQERQAAESARREAEAANRSKAEFLAAMSHELRTPLNAIGGYAELLELGIRGPIAPLQLEDLQRIKFSQRHLLRLVNEILNYARIETGSVKYDTEEVPLRPLIESLEPLIGPQVAAKHLHFRHDDGASDPLIVCADREKTRQVLLNLLSNAIKFTEPGGSVDVHCEADGLTVLVHVRDNGIGIADAEQDRVFEPFVQVDASLTRPHEGAGLGLAISRDLARGMGGDLTVQSTPSQGSIFTLRLPRALMPHHAATPSPD